MGDLITREANVSSNFDVSSSGEKKQLFQGRLPFLGEYAADIVLVGTSHCSNSGVRRGGGSGEFKKEKTNKPCPPAVDKDVWHAQINFDAL
jgi:hypothetical protein